MNIKEATGTRRAYRVVSAMASVHLLCACGTATDMNELTSTDNALGSTDGVGASMRVYGLEFRKRSAAGLAERARLVSRVVLGKDLPMLPFQALADKAAAPSETPDGDATINVAVNASAPLAIRYKPDFDILSVANEDVERDQMSPGDIGQSGAKARFARVAAELEQFGVLDRSGLDPGSPVESNVLQGEGRSGEEPVIKVKEYVFFVPQRIEGVGIQQETKEAGLTVAIHRSGKTASVKIAGPSVRSNPVAAMARAISRPELDARVSREFPGSVVKAEGLRYILHGGADASTIYQTYFVSSRVVVEGRTINGRGQYVSYPIADPTAKPVVWPLLDPNADPGDPR